MPLYCPSTTGMANDTTCPRLLTMLPLVLMIRIASSRTSGGIESSTIRGVLTPTITLPLASMLTRTTASPRTVDAWPCSLTWRKYSVRLIKYTSITKLYTKYDFYKSNTYAFHEKGIVPIISYRLQTDSSIDTMPVCIEIMLRTCQRRL